MDRNSNDDKLIDRDYQQLKDVTWSRGLTDIKVIPLSLQATTSTFNLETHLFLKNVSFILIYAIRLPYWRHGPCAVATALISIL